MKILRYFFATLLVALSSFTSLVMLLVFFNISISFIVKPVMGYFAPNVKLEDAHLGWDNKGKTLVLMLHGVEYRDSNFLHVNFSRIGINVSAFKTIANKKLTLDLLAIYELQIFLEEYENGEIVFTLPEVSKSYGYNQTEGGGVVRDIESLQNRILSDTIVDDNYKAKLNKINRELNKENLDKKSIIETFLESSEVLKNTKQIMVVDSNLQYASYKNKNNIISIDFESISLEKKDENIVLESSLNIPLGGGTTPLELQATLDDNDNIDFEFSLNELMINDVQEYLYLIPENLLSKDIINKVQATNILTSASFSGVYQVQTAKFQDVSASVTMQNGRFNFGDFFTQDIIVNSLNSSLTFDGEKSLLNVEKLELELEKGRSIKIPSIQGDWDAQSISLKASLDFNKHIKLQDIVIKTQSNNLVKGNFSYLFDKQEISFDLNTKNIRFNNTLRYWPDVATENLQKYLSQAVVNNPLVKSFSMGFTSNLKTGKQVYKGKGDIEAVRYNYIDNMPTLFAKQVELEFNERNVLVSYREGNIKDSFLAYGFVKVFGSKEPGEFDTVAIDTTVESNLPSLMALISNKALGIDMETLNPDDYLGYVVGDLQIDYNYEKEELTNLQSQALISDVVAKNVFAGKDFVANTTELKIDKKGVTLLADGVFDDVLPLDFKGVLSLDENAKESAIYTIKASSSMGILRNYKEFDDFAKYFVNNILGDALVTIKYTDYKADGFDNLNVNLNLLENTIEYKNLYSKKPKQNLTANIDVAINKGQVEKVSNINVKGDGIDTQIAIDFVEGTNINAKNLNIKDFYNGDFSLNLRDKGFSLNASGKTLNSFALKSLSDFLIKVSEESKTNQEKQSTGKVAENKKPEEKSNIEYFIKANIGNIYHQDRSGSIKNLNLEYLYTNNTINKLSAKGLLNSNKSGFNIALNNEEASNQGQIVNVQIDNAGILFNALGLYGSILNGYISDVVFIKQAEEGFTVTGTTSISSFSLSGVPFSNALIDFSYFDNILNMESIALRGNILDITAYGNVNIKESNIDLRGQLIPVANVSSLLNLVPIIRNLPLSDGIIKIPISLKGGLKDPDFSFSNR